MKKTVIPKSRGVSIPFNFTVEEFQEEIKKAENGRFYPVEQLGKKMKEWMEQQKKQ